MNWYDQMKAVANKWFGAGFTEETTTEQMSEYFEKTEQMSFEDRVAQATKEIKANAGVEVAELQATVKDLQKKLEGANLVAKKANEKMTDNEVSIETLSEQLAETTKVVKELAAVSNEKFEKLAADNNEKLEQAETAKNEALAAMKAKHDEQMAALTAEINTLKGKKSGGQEKEEGTPPVGKKDEKVKSYQKTEADNWDVMESLNKINIGG